MKKENKKLAQQRKMKNKQKMKMKKIISTTLKIGIPSLLLCVVIAFCVKKSTTSSPTDATGTDTVTESYTVDTSYSVKDGDIVNIDYVGSIDGVEFEGGTAQSAKLEIGSGTFIDDFEEQLIGAHPGETVDVNVTFPSNYQKAPELAGKDALFKVTINGVY